MRIEATTLETSNLSRLRREGEEEEEEEEEGGGGGGGSSIAFSFGNPSVENIRGFLRLFRPVDRTNSSKNKRRSSASGPSPLTPPPESGEIHEEQQQQQEDQAEGEWKDQNGLLPSERSKILCLLAVPEHMSPSEVFTFFGAFLKGIQRVRFVRRDASSGFRASGCGDHASCCSSSGNGEVKRAGEYDLLDENGNQSDDGEGEGEGSMCIVDFRTQQVADEFFQSYDGKRYSSLEEDVCRLVFIEKVSIFSEGGEDEKVCCIFDLFSSGFCIIVFSENPFSHISCSFLFANSYGKRVLENRWEQKGVLKKTRWRRKCRRVPCAWSALMRI